MQVLFNSEREWVSVSLCVCVQTCKHQQVNHREVTEYLACELISDRSPKTATIVEKGYAGCLLKTFGMWDCKPSATPSDAVDYLMIALRLWV